MATVILNIHSRGSRLHADGSEARPFASVRHAIYGGVARSKNGDELHLKFIDPAEEEAYWRDVRETREALRRMAIPKPVGLVRRVLRKLADY